MNIDLTLENKTYQNKHSLSVVIPVYNEGLNIENVLNEWNDTFVKLKINYVFVIVNDGSSDDSLQKIKNFKFPIILINKHNSGHGRSIRHGYDFITANKISEFVLQIDSDGQCKSEHFNDFWSIRNDFDAIIGIRKKRGDGVFRSITTNLARILSSLILGIALKDPNTPYRLINTDVLHKSIIKIPPSFDVHNIALTYILTKSKYKIKNPLISFPDRAGGTNSINIVRVVQLGINLLFDLYFLKKRNEKIDNL